jgi:hypothetical protein
VEAGAVGAGAAVAGAVGDVGAAVGVLVVGVVVAAVLGSVGSSVTAGLAGGVVAVACVEMAARPANTPTPASPPAAIQRVTMVVRAIPRSRSSSGKRARGGWVRFGGSTGWDGIVILTISVHPRFAWAGKSAAATR